VDKGEESRSLGLCNSLGVGLDAGLCDLVRGARTVTVRCALVCVCSVTVSICGKTEMYAQPRLDNTIYEMRCVSGLFLKWYGAVFTMEPILAVEYVRDWVRYSFAGANGIAAAQYGLGDQ